MSYGPATHWIAPAFYSQSLKSTVPEGVVYVHNPNSTSTDVTVRFYHHWTALLLDEQEVEVEPHQTQMFMTQSNQLTWVFVEGDRPVLPAGVAPANWNGPGADQMIAMIFHPVDGGDDVTEMVLVAKKDVPDGVKTRTWKGPS